jgi:hypothetical protein
MPFKILRRRAGARLVFESESTIVPYHRGEYQDGQASQFRYNAERLAIVFGTTREKSCVIADCNPERREKICQPAQSIPGWKQLRIDCGRRESLGAGAVR